MLNNNKNAIESLISQINSYLSLSADAYMALPPARVIIRKLIHLVYSSYLLFLGNQTNIILIPNGCDIIVVSYAHITPILFSRRFISCTC